MFTMEHLSFLLNSTNSSMNTQHDLASMGFYGSKAYRTIVVLLLSVVIILGFLGNVAVISAVSQRHKNIKSPSNYLIMNIAVADLLVAVIVTPLRFVEIYHGWPLGEFLCHFLAPLQDVIVCVSVVTQTVIALERYRGIVTPFKTKMSLQKTKLAIGIIWCACYVGSGLPLAPVLQQTRVQDKNLCFVQWPSVLFRQIFEVYLVIVFILIPLVIQTYAYSTTVRAVNNEISHCNSTQGDISTKQAHKKSRVVRMLIFMVIAFQVCSIPRAFTMLLWEFVPSLQNDVNFFYAITITVIVYYLKHVVNPFIIFITSSEFRMSCCYCLFGPEETTLAV